MDNAGDLTIELAEKVRIWSTPVSYTTQAVWKIWTLTGSGRINGSGQTIIRRPATGGPTRSTGWQDYDKSTVAAS